MTCDQRVHHHFRDRCVGRCVLRSETGDQREFAQWDAVGRVHPEPAFRLGHRLDRGDMLHPIGSVCLLSSPIAAVGGNIFRSTWQVPGCWTQPGILHANVSLVATLEAPISEPLLCDQAAFCGKLPMSLGCTLPGGGTPAGLRTPLFELSRGTLPPQGIASLARYGRTACTLSSPPSV